MLKNYIILFLIFFIHLKLNAQNDNCAFAIPFIDNNCVIISPSSSGPITKCYSFYLQDDSVDFTFIPFVPIGTCEDAITTYILYDLNCNPIDTNTNGEFYNLIENEYYTICYTITCPTIGVVNLICASELITLPVELLYFNARVEYNNIRLLWETATETNNRCFILYHSTDLENWLNIGSVSGAGTSVYPITYSFIFNKASDGLNYFKLVQEDFDGKTVEFSVNVVFFVKKNNITDIFQKYNILGQKID